MRIDRVLVKVKFVTYIPTQIREARAGEINTDAKFEAETFLWAPIAFNDRGEVDPTGLKPAEQGALWAQNKLVKDGYVDVFVEGGKVRAEVLAITEAQAVGPVESRIANQPKNNGSVEEATGLRPSKLITV